MTIWACMVVASSKVVKQQELIPPGSGKIAGNTEAVAVEPVIGMDPVAERRAHAPRIAEPGATAKNAIAVGLVPDASSGVMNI
jgi:hypothetical protein